MEVEKIRAEEVFKDKNNGLVFGLQDTSDFPFYIEWFKTEEEREKVIRENKFKVIN